MSKSKKEEKKAEPQAEEKAAEKKAEPQIVRAGSTMQILKKALAPILQPKVAAKRGQVLSKEQVESAVNEAYARQNAGETLSPRCHKLIEIAGRVLSN